MFVVIVTHHAVRMRRIILSSVACLALQYFSKLSHKRHDFRKGKKAYLTKNVYFDFTERISWIYIYMYIYRSSYKTLVTARLY